MLSLLFSACDKCKLESQYTLEISYSNPVIHNNGTWSSTPGVVIADQIIGGVRSQFREPDQLILLQSNARYVVTIDSILCNSGESTQTVGDPCWESEGWIHDHLFPQQYSTYTLYSTSLYVYFTITDTLTHFQKTLSSSGGGSQYLYLPPADSVNCYGYEVHGTYDHESTRLMAAGFAYNSFKCTIRNWLHGHQ